MNADQISTIRKLQNPQFWLLAVGSGLIAIHLTIVWRANEPNFFNNSMLFWLTVCLLIWEKRHSLNLESSTFSSFFGITIIALILVRVAFFPTYSGSLFILFHFISSFALALIASGFKGLRQYSKELLLLFSFVIIRILSTSSIDISLLTAKFSAFILWYLGFDVTRSGVFIGLPQGNIEVYSGCSGREQILQTLGISLMVMLIFSFDWKQKILLPVVAASLGFIVNAVRVFLMAILVTQGQKSLFKYWHDGDGSLIFSFITVVLFGCFCWFLLRNNERKSQNITQS